MKRKFKDEKFGFGGKKRKIKKNDAESSKDMSSYKPHINGKLKNGNQNVSNSLSYLNNFNINIISTIIFNLI